jgi:hypothetical protein
MLQLQSSIGVVKKVVVVSAQHRCCECAGHWWVASTHCLSPFSGHFVWIEGRGEGESAVCNQVVCAASWGFKAGGRRAGGSGVQAGGGGSNLAVEIVQHRHQCVNFKEPLHACNCFPNLSSPLRMFRMLKRAVALFIPSDGGVGCAIAGSNILNILNALMGKDAPCWLSTSACVCADIKSAPKGAGGPQALFMYQMLFSLSLCCTHDGSDGQSLGYQHPFLSQLVTSCGSSCGPCIFSNAPHEAAWFPESFQAAFDCIFVTSSQPALHPPPSVSPTPPGPGLSVHVRQPPPPPPVTNFPPHPPPVTNPHPQT